MLVIVSIPIDKVQLGGAIVVGGAALWALVSIPIDKVQQKENKEERGAHLVSIPIDKVQHRRDNYDDAWKEVMVSIPIDKVQLAEDAMNIRANLLVSIPIDKVQLYGACV